MGAGEHRRVRRRSEERHDLRRVGGVVRRQRADGVAAGARPVPRAIGESGAYFTGDAGALSLAPLAQSEKAGVAFAAGLGASSLAALRARTADEILAAALKTQPWFAPNLDGYFLTEDVAQTFAAGKQAQVPLLAGWNADEVRAGVVLGKQKPTAQSFEQDTRKRYGSHADAVLKAYPSATDAEALESAAALAGDSFIGHGTWRWIEAHQKTGKSPVYRYSFDRKIPVPPGNTMNGVPATARDIGARHAGEIEYVFGSLTQSLPKVPWEEADRKLSDTMVTYWTNFARTGDPNGGGLPPWPQYGDEPSGPAPRRDDPIGAGHAAAALPGARRLARVAGPEVADGDVHRAAEGGQRRRHG